MTADPTPLDPIRPVFNIGTLPKLGTALAAAAAELKNPPLNGRNPHFDSKYATLADVRNAVVPVLAKHGISVVQDPVTVDGGAGCYTTLLHSSGEHMRFGPIVVPVERKTAHGYGSALTYARRYSLQAVCGVVGEEDDDGNAAVDKPTAEHDGEAVAVPPSKPARKTRAKAPAKPKGDAEVESALRARLAAAGTKDEFQSLKLDIIAAREALGALYEPLVEDFKRAAQPILEAT